MLYKRRKLIVVTFHQMRIARKARVKSIVQRRRKTIIRKLRYIFRGGRYIDKKEIEQHINLLLVK